MTLKGNCKLFLASRLFLSQCQSRIRCLRSPVSLVWIQQLFKESHCMGVELTVLVICKPRRPNLRVYLGFSLCPLDFSFHFVFVPYLHMLPNQFQKFKTFSDVKWRKGTGNKTKDFYKVIKVKTELFQWCCFYLSVLVQKWHIPKKRKVPFGSLNCQKPQPTLYPLPPNSCNISQLVDSFSG